MSFGLYFCLFLSSVMTVIHSKFGTS